MLSKTVDHYLAVRRSLGFKLTNVEIYLDSFAQFAAAKGDTHITARTAIAWASQSKTESQRANRLSVVVRLAQFSQPEDSRHEVPPDHVFCHHRNRPRPYIYPDHEIQALMSEALKLNPVNSLRPHTYHMLIGLLSTTGLRISEALSLRFDSITKDGLIIRETKFRKTRLLPLHETTRVALDQYVIARKKLNFEDEHLFVSRKRRRLSRTAVYDTFHQLLTAAGVSNKPGQPRPRLIDFRHTFATTALAVCPNSRDHVGNHLLALQTYMGHAHVGCTYWYLENTPHLMRDIAQTCSLFFEENTK